MNEFKNGAGFAADELSLLIASLVAAIALVWTAWVGWGQFEAFAAGRANAYTLSLFIGRAVVVLLLLLVFVR